MNIKSVIFTVIFTCTVTELNHCEAADQGQFDPKHLYFSSAVTERTITISNERGVVISWDIEAFEWQQGYQAEITRDILVPTKLFTLSDSRVVVGPGSSASLVITYVGDTRLSKEKAFRVRFTSDTVRQSGVDVTFTQSLPMFVAPLQTARSSVGSASIDENGVIHFSLKNTGNTHIFVDQIRLRGRRSTSEPVFEITRPGWYILQGSEVDYTATVAAADCKSAAIIEVQVRFRGGSEANWQIQNLSSCKQADSVRTEFASRAVHISQ